MSAFMNWRVVAATIALLSHGASSAQGVPAYGFGVRATAGSVQTGGALQNSASATSGNVNVLGQASGSLSGGDLHAYAWSSNNPTLPKGCRPDMLSCIWGIGASVWMWDTTTLNADAGYAPGDEIHYSFSADGSKTPGRWWSANRAEAWYYIGPNPNGWKTPSYLRLGSADEVSGSFLMPDNGAPLTLYVYGAIKVYAEGGAVTDYSHTLSFNWALPQGVSYTSASGQFLAAPVPEPQSLALVLAGLGGVGLVVRRRGRLLPR